MSKNNTLEKSINRFVGKAVADFNMINEGDTILAGLSGGKDSILMLYMLLKLKQAAPINFTVKACMVESGFPFPPEELENLRQWCRSKDVELFVEHVPINEIVFSIRNEKNPCSLCAKLRSGALHNVAVREGCTTVSLGHHADDALESLLMSMIYEGRMRTFKPNTWLDRKELHLIRPLIYIYEDSIRELRSTLDLPVVNAKCEACGKTKREEVKTLLKTIEMNNPDAKKRMLASLGRVEVESFWHKQKNTAEQS